MVRLLHLTPRDLALLIVLAAGCTPRGTSTAGDATRVAAEDASAGASAADASLKVQPVDATPWITHGAAAVANDAAPEPSADDPTRVPRTSRETYNAFGFGGGSWRGRFPTYWIEIAANGAVKRELRSTEVGRGGGPIRGPATGHMKCPAGPNGRVAPHDVDQLRALARAIDITSMPQQTGGRVTDISRMSTGIEVNGEWHYVAHFGSQITSRGPNDTPSVVARMPKIFELRTEMARLAQVDDWMKTCVTLP